VLDPNHGIIGMELPIYEWFVLHCLRTGHGRCADMMFKWRLQVNLTCDYDNDRETVNHIVKEYQLRKFNQDIERIHAITSEAINCIRKLDIQL
jgi:hypothetical protein